MPIRERAMADVVEEMTQRMLVDAGIGAGMRVLDVGCGRGDVTLMLARMVGESGQVVGVDRDELAVATARLRAADAGCRNVRFKEGDLAVFAAESIPFDAIVGRRVLMYLPQPGSALRDLAAALRPGGLIVFQEHDATMVPATLTPLPLRQQVHDWMWETVKRESADVHIGFRLASLFEQAGLVVEQVRAHAVVQTPHERHKVDAIVRAMLPRMVRHGVASEAEVDIETLDARLAAEHASTAATFIGDMVFFAWARAPASAAVR